MTTIRLPKGSHPAPAEDCTDPEAGLFEQYTCGARQTWTDACPPGVSPVLHSFGMTLNDRLPDDQRQALAIYVPNGTSPLAGTARDGEDEGPGDLGAGLLGPPAT